MLRGMSGNQAGNKNGDTTMTDQEIYQRNLRRKAEYAKQTHFTPKAFGWITFVVCMVLAVMNGLSFYGVVLAAGTQDGKH
jgi:hypothetical protein